VRSLFWLWVMFLLVCLVTDSASYWVVRNRLHQSLELALDAALTGSIAEEDLILGRQMSKAKEAESWAREILLRNMSGPLAKTLSFQFELVQDKDQIWAKGQARIELPFLLGVLAGGGKREIVVNRTLRYQGSYK